MTRPGATGRPRRESAERPSARSADRGGVRGGGVPLPAIDRGGNRAAIRAAGPWEERPAAKPDGDFAPSGRGAGGGALFPRAGTVDAGRLGRKTGRGFHDYRGGAERASA